MSRALWFGGGGGWNLFEISNCGKWLISFLPFDGRDNNSDVCTSETRKSEVNEGGYLIIFSSFFSNLKQGHLQICCLIS